MLVESTLDNSVDIDIIYDMLNNNGYEIDYYQSDNIGYYKIQSK